MATDAAGRKAMRDMRKQFGPVVNADVFSKADEARRNALYVLGILVRAYVPKNTNDAREGANALAILRGEAAEPVGAVATPDGQRS